MNKKKVATFVASLALVGAIGVGSTLAYLSSNSGPVVNTFTVGDGYIPADGPDVAVWIDELAQGDRPSIETLYNDDRTLVGNNYVDINPGDKVIKDPVVRLTDDSVQSHVIVRVDGISNQYTIEKAANFDSNWKKINTTTGEYIEQTAITDGYYLYIGTFDDEPDNKYIFNSGNATEPGKTQQIKAVDFFESLTFNSTVTENSPIDNIELRVCALQAFTTQNNVKTHIYDLNEPSDRLALYNATPSEFRAN